MSHLGTTRAARRVALAISAFLGLALAVMAGGFASTAQAGPASMPASSSAAALADPVASTPAGTLTAPITGTTADEDTVTGTFTPLKFSKKNGKLFVRGVIDGTITDAESQTSRTFTVIRKTRVVSMNGTPATARAAQCEVLDLVLAPLRLDLLGLVVNLDRVDLNITAVSGPGNLLGNLLCSVVGLLDGGLDGLLGRVVNLLNRILGQLGLGL